ncbi:MAG: TorF family putative porin [Rhodobacterales bacterium]|nr:TorF family putative porin [Rhodobacterales bacterium]
MRLNLLAAASFAFPAAAFAETSADAAAADGVTLSTSLTFASRYVSDGIEYSDGVVVQPYVELGYAGFYAGIWATNASEELLGAESEVDYYIGYRGEAGAFYYDVGYGYYTYPGASEFNSGEVLVSGGFGANASLYLTAYLAYANEAETLDTSLRVDYYSPVEGLALAATYGDNDSWRYWTVGTNYALNDMVTADVTWHDTDLDGTGTLVAGLTFTFN